MNDEMTLDERTQARLERLAASAEAARDVLQQENERLRAENERLKQFLWLIEANSEKLEGTARLTFNSLKVKTVQILEAKDAELSQLRKVAGELRAACKTIRAAHSSLFGQCCSNPVKNAWGAELNMTLLNEANEQAGAVLAAYAALNPKEADQ
jgi:hypothetical protein